MKIVFDVPDRLVDKTPAAITAGGFDVHAYYAHPELIRRGGAAADYTRLGAERPRDLFTDEERDAAVAAFEAIVSEHQLAATTPAVEPRRAGRQR